MKCRVLIRAIGLVLALIVLQGSACDYRVVEYQRLGRSVEIDPATGDTIITQYWRRGGETTATFKRIKKGDTDRRGEPLPPVAAD